MEHRRDLFVSPKLQTPPENIGYHQYSGKRGVYYSFNKRGEDGLFPPLISPSNVESRSDISFSGSNSSNSISLIQITPSFQEEEEENHSLHRNNDDDDNSSNERREYSHFSHGSQIIQTVAMQRYQILEKDFTTAHLQATKRYLGRVRTEKENHQKGPSYHHHLISPPNSRNSMPGVNRILFS
jgi:hypothetical protein